MSAPKRIVLKFGSGILARQDSPEPDFIQLRKLVEAVAILKREGHACVVVSSGAVSSGLHPLGLAGRPADIATLQACAAVGQNHLMSRPEPLLRPPGLHVAQLLVTHDDLASEHRAARFKATLERLLAFRHVVPVINENDSVATEELRFGDNDKLSSSIARLWQADLLILLTSAPGLLRDVTRPEEGPIPLVSDVDEIIHHPHEAKSGLGTGGTLSTLRPVPGAVPGRAKCLIASGRHPEQIPDLAAGRGVCTRFAVQPQAV